MGPARRDRLVDAIRLHQLVSEGPHGTYAPLGLGVA
jgi:hypothetical protein